MPDSLVIIEDDAELRASLLELLSTSPRFGEVRSFDSAEAAREAFARCPPDFALVDLHLPGEDGISFIRHLKERHPQTRFVMLTVNDEPEVIFRALEAGASGYLVKRLPPRRVLAALEEVQRGGAPMSSAVARLVVEHFHRLGTGRRGEESLTPRESEVLDLLCQGLRSKEIADRLKVGIQTINTHLQHIYDKLQVRSRAEVIAKRMGRL